MELASQFDLLISRYEEKLAFLPLMRMYRSVEMVENGTFETSGGSGWGLHSAVLDFNS